MMAQNKTQVKFTAPLILSVVAVIILTGLFYTASSVFRTLELSQAAAKLSLYRTTIENELQRLEHLPVIVADKITVRNAVQSRVPARLNQELLALSQDARAEAIYVMDVQGLTIAASNFAKVPTFLGKNYGFRQYFQEAMQGKRASLFAIGATTSRAGYFLSAPILRSGAPIGVAVVKLDLTRLTETLEQTNEMILVSNKDDIVVLSSRPEWRYRSLAVLSDARRAEISEERQFGEEELQTLDWEMPSQNTAILAGQKFLSLQAQLENPLWTIRYLGDTRAIRERALLVVAVAAGMMALSALAFLAWRSGRLRFALAASQKDRKRLQREIEVRRQAERRLTRAQDELKRSSKLAALGQLAASVTHELGQPISAMKNYLTAEEIAGQGAQSELGRQLSSIVARMENITKQLRFFASDRGEGMKPVVMQNVVRGALSLLQHDLEKAGIDLDTRLPAGDIQVLGNPQRLEQVVINVVRNAIMAVENLPDCRVNIVLSKQAGQVILSVADNGAGLGGQTIDQLSEPFHTTRSSGEGMGLGLAISASIIEEHGGRLTARDAKTGGAEFVIALNAYKEDD
ncbi:MAG: sensor histidine kinase [Proteobacteria bacterium]|nr:sensor histidine kinase [Pseudomonadota bacterium]